VQGVVPGIDGESAAVHANATVGMQGIVPAIEVEAAVVDDNGDQSLDTLGGRVSAELGAAAAGSLDAVSARVDLDRAFSADSVALRADFQRAGAEQNRSQGCRVVIVGFERVTTGFNADGRVIYHQVVFAPDAIVHSTDLNYRIPDEQAVLAGNRVGVMSADVQLPAAVNGQVRFRNKAALGSSTSAEAYV
jgi:hypothetical protein